MEREDAEAGVRSLDDYLARELPRLTKRERRRMAARGGIRVNGREVTDVMHAVGESDRVELPPPPGGTKWDKGEPKPPARREAAPAVARSEGAKRGRRPGPQRGARTYQEEKQAPVDPRSKRFLARGVRLVFEDDDLLVIDKSTGIVTADPTGKSDGTVFDVVKNYLKKARGGRSGGRGATAVRPAWVIHRLDKEASGLLVFAKTPPAFESLKEQFRSKRTERVYDALVEGVVGPAGHAGTHQSFLVAGDELKVKSIPASSYRGTPGKEARLAVTHYTVVASDPDVLAGTGASLLRVRLETGRKNQIRAHMADLGHPIVGDRRYGAVTDPMERVGLHAAELGFTHPRTGQKVTFSSPAPGPFYRIVGATRATPVSEEASPTPVAGKRGPAELDTSWDRVAGWYDDLLSEKRNDHYEDVIMPGTLRLIEPREGMKLLDVACGQGILCRRLAALGVDVAGVDASAQLIAAATARGSESKGRGVGAMEFHVGDAKELDRLALGGMDAAACIMALGNIDSVEPVFRGIANALKPGGTLTFVVAHPSFRSPGQTSWGWDEHAGKQYRRVEGYLSPGQKAIQMHPGKDTSIVTWTFHRPLQAYAKSLADAGFVIDRIEEWAGKRVSTSGPRAMEENRIRREIPLFLAVRAVKAAE
jgi:RluA family pseudouridine synthase